MLSPILVNGKHVKHFKNQQVQEFPPRDLSNKVSHQLILIFNKPGNVEEIPKDWKGQSLSKGDSRIIPSNHRLLSLTTPRKIQSFCLQLFQLKDTLALIIVPCQSTRGKKSSQKDFFILCIQA